MEGENDKRSDSQENVAQNADHRVSDVASSPSNSSSSRLQCRIVQVLQNEDCEANDRWVLRQEFYDEDLGQQEPDEDQLAEGDEDENDSDYQPPISDADTIEEIGSDSNNGEDAVSDEFDEDDDEFEFLEDNRRARDRELFGSDGDLSADEEEGHEVPINYDRTLPVGHQYLSENLEESRGRQVLAECSLSKIPIVNLPEVILFPGQILPLTTTNLSPRIVFCFKTCLRQNSTTIGLMSNPSENKIGTTAEIRNYACEQGDQLKLILEGRQRFALLSPPFESVIDGQIRVLPEITLGHPYPRISTHLRFFTGTNISNKFIISKHPHWLLKRFEARNIMEKIIDQIKDWCSGADINKEPNDFSYWLASSLPINDGERMKALSFSCAEARLLWLLSIIENSEYFICAGCGNAICYKQDVFSMSRSGPQCSFVNASGFIHDTLTVRRARGLIQDYNWSREFCWFPGYAWRQAHCEACNRHIGWCYRRLTSALKPQEFYGLSRVNLRLHKSLVII